VGRCHTVPECQQPKNKCRRQPMKPARAIKRPVRPAPTMGLGTGALVTGLKVPPTPTFRTTSLVHVVQLASRHS
jgi:hypothetical protein